MYIFVNIEEISEFDSCINYFVNSRLPVLDVTRQEYETLTLHSITQSDHQICCIFSAE